MLIKKQYVQIGGKSHHHITLNPSSGVPAKMVCIFTHGQGDYAERYVEVLHPFTERGIRCILTDLPGHGRSPGKRGHIRLDQIDDVIHYNLKLAGKLPVGIAGHSMGGLLTLHQLTLALAGDLPLPEFCWVNGPLMHPANGHSEWFVNLASKIAKFLPTKTIGTNITAEQCSRGEADDDRTPKLSELSHQRVSLSWGSRLIEFANHIQDTLPQHTFINPFLLTQGLDDQICPPEYAHKLFQQLQWPKKEYVGLAAMRHETYSEPNRQILFDKLADWIEREVTPRIT